MIVKAPHRYKMEFVDSCGDGRFARPQRKKWLKRTQRKKWHRYIEKLMRSDE
jgi:hypothetical protein